MLIEVNPPICRIRDLGSTNHTYLNNRPIIATEVNDGDVITLGATRVAVRMELAETERMLEEADRFVNEAPRVEREPAPVAYSARNCARCGTSLAPSTTPRAEESQIIEVCEACRDAMADDHEILPGYREIKVLSHGGMGILRLAEELKSGRHVVIKTMIPEIESSWRMLQMFLREINISLQLKNPNIVEFFSTGQFDGKPFIIMEYVEGLSAEVLRHQYGGRLPARDVVAMGLQVLDALNYAHRQGVIHRDLKPSNLLVQGEAGSYRVKVTDFGLSRYYRASGLSGITNQGEVRGSIPYMSVEQVMDPRHADVRTNIFGLGATLYTLLTGAYIYPFTAEQDPLMTILEADTVPLELRDATVSPALAAIIDHAIRKDPSARFQSTREMQEELRALVLS